MNDKEELAIMTDAYIELDAKYIKLKAKIQKAKLSADELTNLTNCVMKKQKDLTDVSKKLKSLYYHRDEMIKSNQKMQEKNKLSVSHAVELQGYRIADRGEIK